MHRTRGARVVPHSPTPIPILSVAPLLRSYASPLPLRYAFCILHSTGEGAGARTPTGIRRQYGFRYCTRSCVQKRWRSVMPPSRLQTLDSSTRAPLDAGSLISGRLQCQHRQRGNLQSPNLPLVPPAPERLQPTGPNYLLQRLPVPIQSAPEC